MHPRNKSRRDKEENTKNIYQRKYTQNNISNLKVRVDTVMNRNFFYNVAGESNKSSFILQLRNGEIISYSL